MSAPPRPPPERARVHYLGNRMGVGWGPASPPPSGGPSCVELLAEHTPLNAPGIEDALFDGSGHTMVVVAPSLPVDEARALAQRFTEAGGEVELVPEAWLLYACDPDHPERAYQTMERLRVWETTLIHERGRLGDDDYPGWPELLRRQRFDSRPELEAAVSGYAETWRADNKLVSDDAMDLFAGLSAHEPRLAAAVQDARDPRALSAAIAVLSDWLQSQGDPRGQVGLGTDGPGPSPDPAPDPSWLLGPFRQLAVNHLLRVEWSGCTATALELRLHPVLPVASDRFRPSLDVVRELMRLPALATLRSLVVRAPRFEHLDLRPLLADDRLARLSSLEIECSPEDGDLAALGDGTLAQLRALSVRATTFDVQALCFPELRELELELDALDPALAEAFTEGELEELDSLRLRIRDGRDGRDSETAWLLSRLVGLSELPLLCNFEIHFDHILVTPAIIAALADAAFLDDLSSFLVSCRHLTPEAEDDLGLLGPKLQFLREP